MNVYKSWSFYNPLAGIRQHHPYYLAAEDLISMKEISEFILEDVSSHGDEFEVDAGEEGKIVFKKGGMYNPEITYKWA